MGGRGRRLGRLRGRIGFGRFDFVRGGGVVFYPLDFARLYSLNTHVGCMGVLFVDDGVI